MESFLMSPQHTRKSLAGRLIVSLISTSTVFTVIQAQFQFPENGNGYYGNNPLLQYRNPQQQSLNPYQPQPYNPYQRLASPYNQIENQVLQDPTTSQFQLRNPVYQAHENALLPSGLRTGSRAISQQALQQGPVRGGFSIRNGSYTLEWEVMNPYITFRASRRGTGFVGFAISPSGGMSGADIFIAGIGPTGQPFANDYHHEYQPGGVGSAVPDVSNDYEVLGITESGGYTTARFRRLLNTQDVGEDHAIINAEQNILWSIGPPSRQLEYHGPSNRGVVRLNLLDPPPRFRLRRPIL